MPRRLFFTFVFHSLCLSLIASDTVEIKVPFYSEELELSFVGGLKEPGIKLLDETSIKAYFHSLESQPYASLLNSLQSQRGKLELNDWLYYVLLKNTVEELSVGSDAVKERLLCWFLLSKSGFDTRLTYLGNTQVYVYVYTEEPIFDTPMIVDEERNFVNLSSIHDKMDDPQVPLNLLGFKATDGGKAFSFDLKGWPKLEPSLHQNDCSFNWRGESFHLTIESDSNVIRLMKDYPIFSEYRYLEAPFSQSLLNTLLPQMDSILDGKTKEQSLEILATFTRSGFSYKEDREHFGKNKPMIAEELFHYEYSDCEDRSALFFNLVRSTLDLPMIAIAYPDHLTIAVALEEPIGPAIRYGGKNYYICDPTGPVNSSKIGLIPEGYEKISFEILGSYK